jgi:HK97 family phage major capsid protein
MTTETEIKAGFDALDKKLEKALADHTAEIQKHGKASTEATDKVVKLSEKFAEQEAALRDLAQKQGQGLKVAERQQSWGDQLVTAENIAKVKSRATASFEVKNTILGEANSPQDPVDTIVVTDRLPGIVPGAFRSLGVLDFIPKGTTSSNQIEYTRELSWTNDAAETAEGGAKPESDLTFELVNDPVRTIAHFIKLSKQVLDDAPALKSYVDGRLSHGLRQKLEYQLLRGNGTSPAISGLADSGRYTAFTPETGETALDSLNRIKYAVVAQDYTPNVLFMNPADWAGIERLKRSDDGYVVGEGAAISYINGGLTPTVWGLPVVFTNNVQATKVYCLDTSAVMLFMRQGATVEMGFVNEDFTKNLVTVRAELRAALATFAVPAIHYGALTV